MKRKKIMHKLLAATSVMTILVTCTTTPNQEKEPVEKLNYSIIGRKALLTYPDFKAEVEYLTDSTLHWKTTGVNGAVAEGDEKISYTPLNDTQFFLNWIEKDGLTVSQVIDTKQGNVSAYISYADSTSARGQRSALLAHAKFEWVK